MSMGKIKTSFIHKAMKDKDPASFDMEEKARVIKILREYFGLHGVTDRVLFFNKQTGKCQLNQPNGSKEDIFKKWYPHNPDIMITGLTYNLVIEIDGPVHWQNSKAVNNTNERNEHYDLGNVKMIWFTRDDVRKMSTDTLVYTLANKLGMEPRKKT